MTPEHPPAGAMPDHEPVSETPRPGEAEALPAAVGPDDRSETPVDRSDWTGERITPDEAEANAVSESPESAPPREFEELSLAEAAGLLVRRPLPTLRALIAVSLAPREELEEAQPPSILARRAARKGAVPVGVPDLPPTAAAAPSDSSSSAYRGAGVVEEPVEVAPRNEVDTTEVIPGPLRVVRFVLRMLALLIAFLGSFEMATVEIRTDTGYIEHGLTQFIIAILIWLIAEMLPFFRRLARRIPREENPVWVPPFRCDDMAMLPLTGGRLFAIVLTFGAAIGAFLWNANNLFTLPGVIAWFASILAAVWALAPEGWSPLRFLVDAATTLGHVRVRLSPSLVVLVIILGIGAYFRFTDLAGTPPEMTSDHVEKILDVSGIFDGGTNVFFANNGGRESLHFYFAALLSLLPGLEHNFTLLKLATAIEGMLTILVLYWTGKEIVGRQDKRLGEIVGLLLAAFVAVSAWHVFLSRIGLRIGLTPLFAALVITFLVRGLRYNRRWDFLYAGLALGFGLYAYQVMRMFPLVIAAGAVIGLLLGRSSGRIRLTLIGNLAGLAVIAGVVFVPLFRYSVQYPDDFWNRSVTRVLGDAINQEMDENGNLVRRTPTVQEQIDALLGVIPNLTLNIRNALLAFHWKGDVTWLHNAPNQPTLDPVAGGLLVVGLAAWLARAARRGDPGDWFMLAATAILILPTALALAITIENPSHTRMSGMIPGIYLMVALPLGALALDIARLAKRAGAVIAITGCAALVALSFTANNANYFVNYRESYLQSALPYSDGGAVMREFAVTGMNGYGNVFILAYPYWWDHRALGIAGGAPRWSNTILRTEDIAMSLRSGMTRDPGDPFLLDPNRELLFFLSVDDETGSQWLAQHFPNSIETRMTTYMPREYDIVRVSAPGLDLMNSILQEAGLEPVSPAED